jgi:phosphatidylinositol N-acetylglucosaminyltransferase subunit Q
MLFILLIKYYSSEILSYVHQYSQVIHIQVMEEGVQWLMGFPLGLKTNDNLNKVIGYIVIQGILFWEYCTIYFISIQEMLIQAIGLFGMLGLTITLALISDLIDVLTLHLKLLYFMLSKIYKIVL